MMVPLCTGRGHGVTAPEPASGWALARRRSPRLNGIFYLLDDALRVGEYIQIGSYKGTVESFGFRSVKLRHHRGPLLSVPFGVLGRSRT